MPRFVSTSATWLLMLGHVGCSSTDESVVIETDLPESFSIPDGAIVETPTFSLMLGINPAGVDCRDPVGDPGLGMVVIQIDPDDSILEVLFGMNDTLGSDAQQLIESGQHVDGIFLTCPLSSSIGYLFPVQSWRKDGTVTLDYYLERNTAGITFLDQSSTLIALQFRDRPVSLTARYMGEFEGDGR